MGFIEAKIPDDCTAVLDAAAILDMREIDFFRLAFRRWFGRDVRDSTIACEPFACDGKGHIEEAGKAEVFGLRRKPKPKDRLPEEIERAVMETDGLPFARRTLLRVLGSRDRVEQALAVLRKARLLQEYPPLCEQPGVRVAQTEHTIFIGEDGAEVLTRAPVAAT